MLCLIPSHDEVKRQSRAVLMSWGQVKRHSEEQGWFTNAYWYLKSFHLKTWLFNFLFSSQSACAKHSYQIKSLYHTSKCCFGEGLHGLWTAISGKGKRVWRKGVGERARNYTYSNDVFISQQLYNKKLSGAESDLTINSRTKHALL